MGEGGAGESGPGGVELECEPMTALQPPALYCQRLGRSTGVGWSKASSTHCFSLNLSFPISTKLNKD